VVAAPRCPDIPASALASIDRAEGGCPWIVMRAAGDAVAVAASDAPTQVIATYALPEACVDDACELDGVDDAKAPASARPTLVLARHALDTEHPSAVWIGVPAATSPGPATHLFVPSWREPDVRSEGSRIGPAFHLVPHRCGETIAFFAERRLDGDGDAPAGTTLVAEGAPTSIVDGEVQMTPLDAAARAGCVALAVPLP
jgi:hypothetical protein